MLWASGPHKGAMGRSCSYNNNDSSILGMQMREAWKTESPFCKRMCCERLSMRRSWPCLPSSSLAAAVTLVWSPPLFHRPWGCTPSLFSIRTYAQCAQIGPQVVEDSADKTSIAGCHAQVILRSNNFVQETLSPPPPTSHLGAYNMWCSSFPCDCVEVVDAFIEQLAAEWMNATAALVNLYCMTIKLIISLYLYQLSLELLRNIAGLKPGPDLGGLEPLFSIKKGTPEDPVECM